MSRHPRTTSSRRVVPARLIAGLGLAVALAAAPGCSKEGELVFASGPKFDNMDMYSMTYIINDRIWEKSKIGTYDKLVMTNSSREPVKREELTVLVNADPDSVDKGSFVFWAEPKTVGVKIHICQFGGSHTVPDGDVSKWRPDTGCYMDSDQIKKWDDQNNVVRAPGVE